MSRAYSICLSQFWTGPTSKQLRPLSSDVRELAFYLFTNETAQQEWFGLYRFDLHQAATLTGRAMKTIEKNLAVLAGVEYAQYDPDTEYVWVREMAFIQSGAVLTNGLKAADYKCRQARRWYARVAKNPFLADWFDRYVDDLHLTKEPHPCARRDGLRVARPVPAPVIAADPVEPFALAGPAGVTAKVTRDQMFERLVAGYPKAEDLKNARKEWLALKPTPELLTEILAALAWQTRSIDWLKEEGRFVPALSRYLKHHRWTDQPRRLPRMTEQTVETLSSLDEFVRAAPKEG